jgi:hypothetical protein
MANKVTFDWANLLIIVDNGVTELDVQVDLYSDWKEDVKLTDNIKHPPAFRTTGGDPISPTENIGATFFLINGWKIRPQEADHTLILDGNLFTEPSVNSVFQPTIGDFTVVITTKVSSLITGLKSLSADVTVARKMFTNRLETNQTTGILTLHDDDDSVLLTANIWEDTAGTIGYRGNGVDRRDKLT